MKALCFNTFGEPDVLYYGDVPNPICGENDVIVRTKAIGLNFADTYRRRGNYHLKGKPPYIAGYEAAGIVEEIGEKVRGISIGNRVVFTDSPFANAELVSAPQERIIVLPDDISFETAAAVILQGLTAQYLCNDSYNVQTGQTTLVHAAAGGVGLLLVQMLRAKGARVFGLTSSEAKKKAVFEAGAENVFLYSDDWVAQTIAATTTATTIKVNEYSSGSAAGVDVAFDSVGSTIMDSFRAVRDCGAVVFYGMSGGNPVHIDPRMLMDTSKTLTGGDLWSYITSHEDRVERSMALFELVRTGKLQVHIAATFALRDGAKAHEFLESRKSSGKVLLIP